jgi:3-hydroxymyristoyl/3-hydroxydecanoyl-(acyl carrier protein) dehydratase
MRFQLFDKILEFNKGKSIVGVKNPTLESGNLIALNGALYYPAALSIEALAQLGGWFITASRDFSLLVVLGMITNGEIHQDIMIGDSLILKVNLLELMPGTSIVRGEVWKEGACAIKINRIVYGMFEIQEDRFVREQKKMFSSLLRA